MDLVSSDSWVSVGEECGKLSGADRLHTLRKSKSGTHTAQARFYLAAAASPLHALRKHKAYQLPRGTRMTETPHSLSHHRVRAFSGLEKRGRGSVITGERGRLALGACPWVALVTDQL